MAGLLFLAAGGCNPGSTPVAKALHFLRMNQVVEPVAVSVGDHTIVDFPGDWPQFYYLEEAPAFRVPEMSPFIVSFIHHALSHINNETAAVLGLSQKEVEQARVMRRRAVDFMRLFASGPEDADAGTFGFWPRVASDPATQTALQQFVLNWLEGPVLRGSRAPANLPFYPTPMAIPADADVTSTTYAVLLDDALLDGGTGAPVTLAPLLAGRRDTGDIPRRLDPDWLPPASGAFFTWLTYGDAPGNPTPNDIDLVVNANALYALARFGATDTPGFEEAVALINHAVRLGLHRTRHEDVSDYYPDNFALHYCVSRAYAEGPAPGLGPAVAILADDLEGSALMRPDGAAYWDKGDPHLNTAFAVLTLLNAGRDTPLIDRAVAYLVTEQNGLVGSWQEGVFFIGQTDSGQRANWVSESFSTAIALEALCRYELDRAPLQP